MIVGIIMLIHMIQLYSCLLSKAMQQPSMVISVVLVVILFVSHPSENVKQFIMQILFTQGSKMFMTVAVLININFKCM